MREALKDGFVVRGFREFLGEVLSGPMLVVHSTPPESAFGDIVDAALIGDIDLFFVLSVVESELMTFELFHGAFFAWGWGLFLLHFVKEDGGDFVKENEEGRAVDRVEEERGVDAFGADTRLRSKGGERF